MPNKIIRFENKQANMSGTLEIKNETAETADLDIYGYIVSSEDCKWNDTDVCPKDVQNFLNSLDNKKECHIYMNSGGGSVFAGIAIANQLKKKKCKKVCHIDGLCASIATVIATACDEIIIPENGFFMIHKPATCFLSESLNADDLRKETETLDTIQKGILASYMSFAKEGVSEETINDYINNETWFTGVDACELFNFTLESATKEMVACGDLSKFKNCPKELLNVKPDEEEKPEESPVKPEESPETPDEPEEDPDKKEKEDETDEIVNKVIEALEAREKKQKEDRKNAVLEKLNSYGGLK